MVTHAPRVIEVADFCIPFPVLQASGAQAVTLVTISCLSDRNGFIHASTSAIARKIGISRGAAEVNIRRLEERGLLERQGVRGTRRRVLYLPWKADMHNPEVAQVQLNVREDMLGKNEHAKTRALFQEREVYSNARASANPNHCTLETTSQEVVGVNQNEQQHNGKPHRTPNGDTTTTTANFAQWGIGGTGTDKARRALEERGRGMSVDWIEDLLSTHAPGRIVANVAKVDAKPESKNRPHTAGLVRRVIEDNDAGWTERDERDWQAEIQKTERSTAARSAQSETVVDPIQAKVDALSEEERDRLLDEARKCKVDSWNFNVIDRHPVGSRTADAAIRAVLLNYLAQRADVREHATSAA